MFSSTVQNLHENVKAQTELFSVFWWVRDSVFIFTASSLTLLNRGCDRYRQKRGSLRFFDLFTFVGSFPASCLRTGCFVSAALTKRHSLKYM